MFIHFYTYDVLIKFQNYDKNSLVSNLHVNVCSVKMNGYV
jgi:hypothetical protein